MSQTMINKKLKNKKKRLFQYQPQSAILKITRGIKIFKKRMIK